MEGFIDFITFKDPNVIYVVLGVFFINSSSAMIGTFAYLRKRSLIGDAVAHALLPGVCLGFLFTGQKDILPLLLGATFTGWLSTYLVDLIVNNSKIKQDAAIGIVLSSFFAIGIVLLTYIQKNAAGQQGGLQQFLFGQAAAISKSDLTTLACVFVLIVIAIVLLYRPFQLISFNRDFAKSIGMPVRFLEFILTTLTVLSIAAGIQALGVILMSALIITPAATARFWTHRLRLMLVLAASISVISGISGAYVSYVKTEMPTGPWIVLILSLFTMASFFLSPQKGIFSRYLKSRANRRKILHENILKVFYQFHEEKGEEQSLGDKLKSSEILAIRTFDTADLTSGLRFLCNSGMMIKSDGAFQLTDTGRKESRRIVRLHRLWEQYLLKRTTIDTEHVHSGAEAIEHVITPELERELERELGLEGIPKEDY